MLTAKCNKGDMIICTKDLKVRDLHGKTNIAAINKGDKAIYLGRSQVRMIDGPAKNWLFTLTIMAPFADCQLVDVQEDLA